MRCRFGYEQGGLVGPVQNSEAAVWHHWCCRFDHPTLARHIFSDGVSIATDSATDSLRASGQIHIGSGSYTSTSTQTQRSALGFGGALDDVVIWHRWLKDTEIFATAWSGGPLAAGAGSRTDLYLYLPFSAGAETGGAFTDWSSNQWRVSRYGGLAGSVTPVGVDYYPPRCVPITCPAGTTSDGHMAGPAGQVPPASELLVIQTPRFDVSGYDFTVSVWVRANQDNTV